MKMQNTIYLIVVLLGFNELGQVKYLQECLAYKV